MQSRRQFILKGAKLVAVGAARRFPPGRVSSCAEPATVVIFALTLTIQEFVYSLTFISSVGRMTVSAGCRWP